MVPSRLKPTGLGGDTQIRHPVQRECHKAGGEDTPPPGDWLTLKTLLEGQRTWNRIRLG